MLFRETGDGVCTGCLIGLGNFHRVEIRTNQSLGRRRFFYLADAGNGILFQRRFQRNRFAVSQSFFRPDFHCIQTAGSLFPFQLLRPVFHNII